jgi:hypothetical protein
MLSRTIVARAEGNCIGIPSRASDAATGLSLEQNGCSELRRDCSPFPRVRGTFAEIILRERGRAA